MYGRILSVVVSLTLYCYVSSESKRCDCACANLNMALQQDPVLKAKIMKMVNELKVDTKNTSSHLRSLTSATDDRPSAKAAGFVGVVILASVIGFMMFSDAFKHLMILIDKMSP